MDRQIDIEEIFDIPEPVQIVRLKAGEFLFHEGDEAHALYLVRKGSVRVVSGSTVYETVGVGGIVGEMGIIEHDMPRSANVIAGTYAELTKSTKRGSCR